MYLKRGIKRQSCDFCFRRKVKCDWVSRESEGHSQCSHCELRDIACTNSDDRGRARRSLRRDVRAAAGRISSSPDDGHVADDGNPLGSTDDTNIVNEESISALPQTQLLPIDPNLQYPTFDSESAWQDIRWDLGAESISFLDSVFTHDYNFDNMPNSPQIQASEEVAGALENPYEILELDPSTLKAAIDAYFDLTSLAIPILDRNAFQADYTSHRASPALVYAVACRGCPFLSISRKWLVQQRLASEFRRAWLEARSAAGDKQSIRLDDLEALALMVDFAYEPAEDVNTALHSQLGSLFLTHDSLVLMTLQYHILCHAAQSERLSAPLHGIEERKRLLFWYVYGKDTFRALDQKSLSRIRDGHAEIVEQLPEHEERTYLDAILSLTIIVRKIKHEFLGVAAGNVDVGHQYVVKLYGQLEEWRKTLPPYLLWDTKRVSSLPAERGTGRMAQVRQLQQAVLLFLEHNCCMQIERCASECGITGPISLEAVMLNHLIEYQTLAMTNDIIEAVKWLQSQKICQNTPQGTVAYPLIDLSPDILRDICAGTAYWLCDRGKKLVDPDKASVSSASHGEASLTQGAENFAAKAALLRDSVATAKSHKDTSSLVEKLDEQLSSLNEAIKSANSG
ncbi:fungal transcriptional regulatory [Fusarium phyllophilum]|uniref:Fungal transcriptional regulatory n=1 Tax=Fusarium phyllophilum TaxID=47803 RepID=A0A8H5IGC4_9HYPO|nr:fungal transcriptional regulatory [Fusarium phyllophilum]